jgi:transposase
MKKKQRKSYTAAFKVKIALEAIKGQRTINEIATHYGVHLNMVTQWKKQAIESLPDVFSTWRERDAQGQARSPYVGHVPPNRLSPNRGISKADA